MIQSSHVCSVSFVSFCILNNIYVILAQEEDQSHQTRGRQSFCKSLRYLCCLSGVKHVNPVLS